jgi:hypothetical protein
VQFGDFSPPFSPSPDQQREALKKGLGRAVQWSLAGRLHEALLLNACLRDQRFDMQVEDTRGDWLWQMIHALGAVERFRVPILHALYDLSEDRSAAQLCELAGNYAKAGDEAFRTRLYEIVERRPLADSPWLGEEEIIALDGASAFLFAAGVRGRELANRAWDWHDRVLMEHASELFGETQINQLLSNTIDESIRRFRAGWDQALRSRSEQTPQLSYRESLRAIRVSEIIADAESREGRLSRFRGWGMHADEADLQMVLVHLWTAQEPAVIAKLLRVFSNRPLPQFDARLIELCRHPDPGVRCWAFNALEENKHPLIWEFAVSEVRKSALDSQVAGLFINNYRQGDEQLVLESFALPDDEAETHWLLMDIVKMLEANPEADCSRLGIIAYALTPCTNCRSDAARLLHRRHVAPEWLTEECRYDVSQECRELGKG